MKNIILIILALIIAAIAFMFGTFRGSKTVSAPPAQWAQDIPDGAAREAAQSYREFLTAQEAATARIFALTDDPLEQREGLDWLQDLSSLAYEMKVDKGSSIHPALTDWMGTRRKVFGDVADAIYHTAQISPDHSYVIKGQRGDAEYLGFQLYGRMVNGWNRAAGNLNDDGLRFARDGSFQIILSATKPLGENTNWLELTDDIHMIMTRQYFHDRPHQKPATLSISNLNTKAEETSDHAARQRDATHFFNEVVDGTLALGVMSASAPNSADPPRSYNPDFSGLFYPTEDNAYFGTWYQIEPGQALMVEGPIPAFAHANPYWSVSLQNRWLQSLDYIDHQTSLHDRQIIAENGRYSLLIAQDIPDDHTLAALKISKENVLSTTGHSQGILAIRYQQAESFERPVISLITLDKPE